MATVKTKIKQLIGHDEWRQKLLKDGVVLEDGVRLSELQSYNDPPTNEVRVSLMLHEGDLVRLAAGTARDPHRAMLILVSGPACYQEAGFDPAIRKPEESWHAGLEWARHLEFSAFRSREPGTIRIAVGRAATGADRVMLNHHNATQAE